MNAYKRLFDPIKIGSLTIKNRIFIPPTSIHLAEEGGAVNEKVLAYFRKRAEGGVGMITVASILVDKYSRYGTFRNLCLYDDSQITDMKKVTDAIHCGGAVACAQLLHPSSSSLSKYNNGMRPVAASAIGALISPEIPREITKNEIAFFVKEFGEAARRAKAAGFDAIEIHCCHRHGLLGNFLSPLHNKRTDEYGGTVDGRLKMPLEAIAAVRKSVGDGFPIIVRMSATDEEPGGQSLEEGIYIAKQFEKASVNMIHLSTGTLDIPWRTTAPGGTAQGFNEFYAREIRRSINIPLAFVGRIIEARTAEGILERDSADAVYIGRANIADPEFANKSLNGDEDSIRPCIGCMRCLTTVNADGQICCSMNPEVGHEAEETYGKISETKKILVVGGGAAGLTAASYSAQYGFDVTIAEKTGRLGGQMYLAGIPPCKHDVTNGLKYMIKDVESKGVRILTNTKITKDDLAGYDAVIVAAGGSPIVPAFLRGADRLVTGEEVLDGKTSVGKNIVIVGGGPVGCEVADFVADPEITLSQTSRTVTIIEMLDLLEKNEFGAARSLLMQRLVKKRVHILTSTKVTSVNGNTVKCEGPDEEIVLKNVDTIIAALGTKQDNSTYEEILATGIPVEQVTDTVNIYTATSHARSAARAMYQRFK